MIILLSKVTRSNLMLSRKTERAFFVEKGGIMKDLEIKLIL